MTARLTLICHAPTAATREARFPRDEAADGVASALALAIPGASRLSAGPVFAGPERRCRDTATALGLGFAVDEALRDQDFGRWAGRSLTEVAAAEPDALGAWTGDPAAAPHRGESVAALLVRIEGWMGRRAADGGRAAAVTHPAVLRAAVSAALGAGAAGFWRVEAPPLTRARLTHDGRRWALAALLPPDATPRAGSAPSSPPPGRPGPPRSG